MQKITKEELLQLARLSRLKIDDNELSSLTEQISDILSYALRVKDVAQLMTATDALPTKACNIMRPDTVIRTNPDPILGQAPETEQNYFVVPVILETT